jgi:flagellar basal body-associated protein FliL
MMRHFVNEENEMKRPVVITLLVVALILVCVGIGSVIYFANDFQTNNPFDTRNISSVLEESKTLKVDTEQPVALKVVDDAGSIIVSGGDVETVQVKAIKTAYDSNQARADEEVKGMKFTVDQTGNAITIKYEIPKSMNIRNNINTVDFIITVPTGTSVDVDTSFGEVDVSGTKGDVVISNDFGDVAITNLEGALSVDSNSGEITLESVKAAGEEIDLHTDFGNVTLEKVSARDISAESNSGTIRLTDVRATGEFFTHSDFGDVKYENGSAGTLNIETNSGRITLVKLKITKALTVNDDFGDIELEQTTAGSYDLHTNSGAVMVDGVKGELKAYTDFGNITILNAEAVILDVKTNSGNVEFTGSLGEGTHLVRSDFGGIQLSLPADIALNVDLKTDFGNIKSDLPVTVTLNETSGSEKDQIVGSINGGGDQLTVQTNSGNISIKVIK